MKIGTNAQLAVKWANNEWTYYRVSRHRSFEALLDYYTKLDNFRFGILYDFDSKTKLRGLQIGYFSKSDSWLNNQ